MILSVLMVMSFIVLVIAIIVVMVFSHKAYHAATQYESGWCYAILDVAVPVVWIFAVMLTVSGVLYTLV